MLYPCELDESCQWHDKELQTTWPQKKFKPWLIKLYNLNSTNGDDSHTSEMRNGRPQQPARVCTYSEFTKCQPLSFKGTEGVAGLTCWFKRTESVFHISGCAPESQVKFETCTMLEATLTWWNTQVRDFDHDAAYVMTWSDLKNKLTEKYRPKGELHKLNIKLWN